MRFYGHIRRSVLRAAAPLLLALAGCSLIPDVVHQPVVHNPFPQLTKIAVAPFFNLSTEPSVDGRQFALAYFNELQLIQGFEVIPVGVVEETIKSYGLSMSNPREARKLAQILGADAVVIGAITDFSPYYPPRCGMQVEWYAANPCFHPIPPGYGLPWGTTSEEYIPAPLVLESEMALARAQLATQTPEYRAEPVAPPPPAPVEKDPAGEARKGTGIGTARLLSHAEPSDGAGYAVARGAANASAALPGGDAFAPPGPGAARGQGRETNEPVLRHTRTYNGHDGQFTTALESFAFFQDDARFGGWQSYLQRSDDFIRFCCRMHLYEMLSARGGADETRVVWRWSHNR